MELKIDQAKVEAAIQSHLTEVVEKGLDYRCREQLNEAMSAAITPEVVQGFVESTMKALTDPTITDEILSAMKQALHEAIRVTIEEAIVAVAVRLRGYRTNVRSTEDEERIEALRKRLFPEST